MRYSVSYADGEAVFDTEVRCKLASSPPITERSVDAILEDGLPLAAFSEFASSSERLIFVLCDGTRSTPSARILEYLYPEIARHPNTGFIIATGTHRPPTDSEYRTIFGNLYDEFMPRTLVHDSLDREAMVHLGKTTRGTPVSLSRHVLDADGIVTINSVEPHYFAGYTGGRKSFLPGVAAYESIEKNHSHAAEPRAMPMVLDGNPVSEDMFEALKMVAHKRIFSIQVVLTPENRLHSVFSGDIVKSFEASVEDANRIFSVPLEKKASIVITVAAPPMDIDLYQSQKALEHASLAVRDGGVIILVSSCRDGIGNRDFFDIISGWKDGDDVSGLMGDNYKLGNHKVTRLLELSARVELFALTLLDAGTVESVGMKAFGTLQDAVSSAIARVESKGMASDILILPNGSVTVPKVVDI